MSRMTTPKGREVVLLDGRPRGGPVGRVRPRSSSGPMGPGVSWSVWQVPTYTPRRRARQDTLERRAALERYRRATDQAPWDVPASWSEVTP